MTLARCLIFSAALLGACSPALNWRSVALDDVPLALMLPCKPDRAVRDVAWGTQQLSVSMVGCEADGATYTLAHAVVQPQDAAVVMGDWQKALYQQLQIPDAWQPLPGQVLVWPGTLELPQARQVQWQGKNAQGKTVYADARWFARTQGQQVRIYQAMVLAPGKPVAATALQSFVQGLQLR
ncbi:hypothetical protein HS961_00655 [Comamonas piscis]|uniref:Uncharacterized protein n=1 Tax=Comamonas piscis TaxID=1562974 RepID=A0A7G5EBT5_9BURK|nr:hypothetical protein [Comamonas piscis]QMV71460.1 hypothetical protein HS961_00655 [Comamonas piscis]WSO34170.1 hypothetical protein VUJ63_00655 [Comamonas piscis]